MLDVFACRVSESSDNSIDKWTSKIRSSHRVNKLKGKPSPVTNSSTSLRSDRVPSLTRGSSSSKLVISNDVAIQDNEPNHNMDDTFQVYERRLEDEDETFGAEWDDAVASPVKGKARLTSTVFYFIFSSECRANTFICLSLGHR